MLRLDTSASSEILVSRAKKRQKLSELKKALQLYFGFTSKEELSQALALRQTVGSQQPTLASTNPEDVRTATTNLQNYNPRNLDQNLVRVFNDVIDYTDDARRILDTVAGQESVMGRINESLRQANPELINRYADCIKIHYSSNLTDLRQSQYVTQTGPIFYSNLDNALPLRNNESAAAVKTRIAAVRMEHPLLMPGDKNSELLTVFFNAMPALEVTRATPVLNVTFFSSREITKNGRLSAITLQKFLEGAVEETEDNIALRSMNLASQITASFLGQTDQNFQNYTVTGLELFRAPQTLVNIDATKNKDNYLAPVIDPMRPLASIKSFTLDLKSAYGLQGTRTGTLEIVLHDRSRLGEFADFVKPDRYGTSFIEVEYGWSHPDPLDVDNANIENPYANLLNLTRVRDHLNVVSSTLNFDEVGQVNITLNLIGRGSSETTELSIVGPSSAGRIQTLIRQIQEISQTVNELSARLNLNAQGNSNSSNSRRREIRGIQALSAAQDAVNNLVLSNEVLKNAGELRTALSGLTGVSDSSVSTAATQLRQNIDNLIGRVTGTGSNLRVEGPSRLGDIQRTVNEEIRGILNQINNNELRTGRNAKEKRYNDVFFNGINDDVWTQLIQTNGRVRSIDAEHHDAQRESTTVTNQLTTGNPSANATQNRAYDDDALWAQKKLVSLGTLITAFVAKPLAELVDDRNQPKFQEVQVLFYNFNNKASLMSKCNISQFPVSTKYFVREYSRLRLENFSRVMNLSVNEFINFIATRIVDDVMNPAYKIDDLYKTNQDQVTAARPETFDVDMMNRMKTYNVGQHSDFAPPQVTIEMEALPIARTDNTSNPGTILKIHVYDKVCSVNSSYRELLGFGTDNFMSTFSVYPGDQTQAQANLQSVGLSDQERADLTRRGGNAEQYQRERQTNLLTNWRELHEKMIERAVGDGIIQPVQEQPLQHSSDNPTNSNTRTYGQYRFVGGPQRLKEFVMKGVPHIIYGAMGTTIRSANLSSISDSLLNSINMQRSLNANPILPNGAQIGGVPLSLYPLELTMTSVGCPILRYGQEIFIDFNTNTSADNIYFITGIQHKLEAGTFETTIKFTANDAFGQYRNMIQQLNTASETLNRDLLQQNSDNNPARPVQANNNNRRRTTNATRNNRVRSNSGNGSGTPPART